MLCGRIFKASDASQRAILQTQLLEVFRADDRVVQSESCFREHLKLGIPNLQSRLVETHSILAELVQCTDAQWPIFVSAEDLRGLGGFEVQAQDLVSCLVR
ncbi:hypothetical protein D9M71_676870 [compost metagenome]